MTAGDAVTTKEDLRRRLLEQRRSIQADDHAVRSDRICDLIRALPEIESARHVHVYWPILDRREVDVRPLIAWLYTHGKRIVLPVVVDPSGGTGPAHMEHRRFVGEDALVRSRWGIDEPMGTEAVSPSVLDVVIVPALGVDATGNRIGYGGGYYDRFLRDVGVSTICPVFSEGVLPHIPTEDHDVRIDVIVTEAEVVRIDRAQHNGRSAV